MTRCLDLMQWLVLLFCGVSDGTSVTAFSYPSLTRQRAPSIGSKSFDRAAKGDIRLSRSLLSPSTSQAARSICTFDDTDFAGASGTWPYQASDLNRLDNSKDDRFYDEPRFVTHIDDGAITSLTKFYRVEFQKQYVEHGERPLDVLDLCSSWISHFPDAEETSFQYGRVVGLGMNRAELDDNKQLTDVVVQDLNEDPNLSKFEDNSFDIICNVVSVDYLTKPLEVFQEMHRILRPGGIALMSFSNRCFATKAIAMWLQADDIGRLTIVASYYHYASEDWSLIEALDLKEQQVVPGRPSAMDVMANPALGLAWMNSASAVQRTNAGDPMFVVKGVKKAV